MAQRCRQAVAAIVIATVAIFGLAPAANAQTVPVVYADDQVADLLSSAGYLGYTDEELHVAAASVHHFLLGVAGKLAVPNGGCAMNLGEFVDAGTGSWYVDVDFADSESNGLVAAYYCLTPAQAAKTNVTLLVFLASINASQNGISIAQVQPTDRNGLTLVALFTPSFDADLNYVADGDWIAAPFYDNGTLHLLIVNMEGLATSCFSMAIIAADAEVGAIPDAGGYSPINGTCVPVPGLAEWEVLGRSDSMVVIDTGFVPTETFNVGVFEQDSDGMTGAGFALTELLHDAEPLGDDTFFLSLSGSSEMLRRSGDRWVPTVDSSMPPRSCAPGATVLCLANGRYQVTSTYNDLEQSGAGQARTKAFGGTFADVVGDTYLVLSVVDGCVVFGTSLLTAEAMWGLDYTLTVTDLVTGSVMEYSNTGGDAVFDSTYPCP